MDTVLTSVADVTPRSLEFSNERWSIIAGLLECLDEGDYELADAHGARTDAADTTRLGTLLREALVSQRVYRSVSPIANDGSLSMGISTTLGAVADGEDIFDDAGSEEQRFELWPDDEDYAWVLRLATFLEESDGCVTTRVALAKEV